MKIKVVEKNGRTLKQELIRSNPFGKQKCDKKCVMCEDHSKINGRHEDKKEEIKYGGQTSRSIVVRFDEHEDDIQKKKSDTPIYQLFVEEHN